MSVSHLAHLNPEQRRAGQCGGAHVAPAAPRQLNPPAGSDLAAASPLLIIAGAGSGKTNTLAHRVAHLVANGVDSRRIMLLTFSRRAAAEMTRRVERITANLQRGNQGFARALTWSGTFHAIGARLLREYAPQIGLNRAFTIHDLPSIRARSTRKPRWATFSRRPFPGARPGKHNYADCSRPMSKPSSASTCSITTICCSIGRR